MFCSHDSHEGFRLFRFCPPLGEGNKAIDFSLCFSSWCSWRGGRSIKNRNPVRFYHPELVLDPELLVADGVPWVVKLTVTGVWG